ncbi:paired domain-containing protein [Trichonephila clavipes]|nr:paired domain-containing protein [Trichonephila clavipes]
MNNGRRSVLVCGCKSASELARFCSASSRDPKTILAHVLFLEESSRNVGEMDSRKPFLLLSQAVTPPALHIFDVIIWCHSNNRYTAHYTFPRVREFSVALLSNRRSFGDGPLNIELWSKLHKEEKSFQEIGKILKLSFTTFGYIVKKYLETGSVENKPRPGGPSKWTTRAKRMIVRSATNKPMTSAQNFTNELLSSCNVSVSAQTVRNVLHSAGLKKKARELPERNLILVK